LDKAFWSALNHINGCTITYDVYSILHDRKLSNKNELSQ